MSPHSETPEQAASGAVPSCFQRDPVPARAGVGLRHTHVPAFLEARQPVAWIEVHSENYLGAGGPRAAALEQIRRDYPLSCHGVGLSLGSAEGLDRMHLSRLKALFDRFQPGLVSDHVAWSTHQGDYLNDLLPLPYTDEALQVICTNIDHAQEVFGRRMLVENPSSYVRFPTSNMAEWQFMAEIVARTGCGLLLDVNNIHVSAHNHRFDAHAYLDHVPLDAVEEIHVAGHFVKTFLTETGEETILIDDHGAPVPEPVWDLFREALYRLGPVPTLVEWDTKLPPLDVLLAEVRKADALIGSLAWDETAAHEARRVA